MLRDRSYHDLSTEQQKLYDALRAVARRTKDSRERGRLNAQAAEMLGLRPDIQTKEFFDAPGREDDRGRRVAGTSRDPGHQ